MTETRAAEPRPATRLPARLTLAAVVLLLALMAVPMVTSAVQQSPTIDEPVYVSAALDYVRVHDLRRNPEHPPLGKLVIAAGVGFAHVFYDPAYDGTQQAVGRKLLYDSGNNPWRVMFAARLPMIVLTLLFGLVVFGFARDLAGPVGGLLALAGYAVTPDLITHGALATLDVPAAGFVLTATWMVWRARRRPEVYLPLAGLALGAALATRANTLPVVPVLLALAIWSVHRRSKDRQAQTANADVPAAQAQTANADADVPAAQAPASNAPQGQPGPARAGWLAAVAWAVVVGAVAVATVWLVYLAVDPRLRWTTPPGVPDASGLRGFLVDLLPLPRAYRDGMRIQFGFDDQTYWNFLYGHQYRDGRWYYLPAALLVKTPIGTMLLWTAATVLLLAVRRLRPIAPYLLLPPLVLYAGVANASRDYGTRYAIFVPIFLAVATALLTTIRARPVHVATGVLLAYAAVSSASTFPYYLPYSNEAFGGPAQTHRWLDDSNVDWGQDLGRLADRLRTKYPGEPVWLSYKGSGIPGAYGITARDPLRAAPEQVRGLLVISDSRLVTADPKLRALLREATPIDTVGHSITIFRR